MSFLPVGGNVYFAMDLHQKDHHENALALMQSHHYQVSILKSIGQNVRIPSFCSML